MKILIEGWRGISHSYSIVNQFQIIELLKNPEFSLYHKDIDFYNSDWSEKKNFCGFSDELSNKILSLKNYSDDESSLDVVYRISFPYNLNQAYSKKLFVFGTSEFQNIDNSFFVKALTRSEISFNNSKIVTPSNWSKQGFLNYGFREEDVLVIPHGIDPSIFNRVDLSRRQQFRKALGVEKSDFLIGSIGAMTWNKGIDVLLRSFSHLSDKYPHVKLLLKDQSSLYGIKAKFLVLEALKEVDELKKVKLLSRIICLSSNITFSQLNGIYSACDCYVSPYRGEGFNMTPLEAAASGTPIIITNGGSTDDYFDSSFALKIESRLVKEKTMTYLEPSFESLIVSISNIVESKVNFDFNIAKSFIHKNFTWDVVTKNLVKHF